MYFLDYWVFSVTFTENRYRQDEHQKQIMVSVYTLMSLLENNELCWMDNLIEQSQNKNS